ncbi:aldehyde dehydrogenase family protein [Cohaesibacter sp. CAU 1516]|uniref:aldehyde dehydrogenase family protein n=2 Tax=Cohaesibacter TaxID=655352 RepID=UPI000DE931A1|nr:MULTISPECIES: aldehyde dehydrogenase family protein [Cohaesibacter]TLP43838.1 aldehyde dehydrogenase family protein [Cohaesibacter sp. CAU 1516]
MTETLAKRAGSIAQGKVWANLIDGEAVPAASGKLLDLICPSDGQAFCQIARSTKPDVDEAVAAARKAFEGRIWSRMTATQRGRCLSRLALLVDEHHEELAALESRDTGKPLRQADADITMAARYFEFYGGAADKIMGDTIPMLDGFTALTLREPHGVVGSIVPWNYPAQIGARVIGAALAMGNCLVIKPAEEACLSILRMAELADEAGIPPGVLNVVTGHGEEAGSALSGHPGIDFLTFTGSPTVGTLVQKAAADNHVGTTLELGGKSPQILFEDADLQEAMPVVTNAIIQNAGQTCSAGSRLLVHQSLWDAVEEQLITRFNALTADRHDRDADLGPLISSGQADRIDSFMQLAADRDIPVLAAGSVASDAPDGGFYAAPTLFGPVPNSHPLAQDEIFGPVLSMIPFRDEQEAIDLANGTPFGLVAGVWTRDAARSMRMARAVRAGQVFINGYGAGGGVELPFGGFKKSGHGREKGMASLLDMSALKTIIMKHG